MKCKITKYFSKKEISKWLKEEKRTICGVFREIPFSSNKTAKSSRYLLIATVYTDTKKIANAGLLFFLYLLPFEISSGVAIAIVVQCIAAIFYTEDYTFVGNEYFSVGFYIRIFFARIPLAVPTAMIRE